jgi:hypothetical protein
MVWDITAHFHPVVLRSPQPCDEVGVRRKVLLCFLEHVQPAVLTALDEGVDGLGDDGAIDLMLSHSREYQLLVIRACLARLGLHERAFAHDLGGSLVLDRPVARELLALGQGAGIQTIVFIGYYDVVHEIASKRDSF